ncbi:MAG: cytochrome d ubiquinol oxidase subunit II [Fibromonadales bacterium]|nr:cytochrome d ubiquinol oxidase subunit II [Fibromonadales bacterium]
MDLEILWFVLIAVLWTGFFFLEGFDFGVSILQFFLGKNEKERGTYISAITPHWSGNEVWLLTAGGAMFAAFPRWYATFFSVLYVPLVLLLLALIVRGMCFEIRHRSRIQKLCHACDIALAVSSFLIAILTSIALTNFAVGIPLDSNGYFIGHFPDLIHTPALFGALLGLSLCLTNGALYLTLKIEGELQIRACKISKMAVISSLVLFTFATFLTLGRSLICIAPLVFILLAAVFVFARCFKIAFVMVALCTVCSVAGLFFFMYPNVLVSSVPENSLTIMNCASSNYTLEIMSIVAVIFVPVVLAYQIWSYYIFRKRISSRNIHSSEV